MDPKLIIPGRIWEDLLAELSSRGRGDRESGAFLLGIPGTSTVERIVYYDDLDPKCLDTGIIRFRGECYIPLWNLCSKYSLTVLADVHTHPSDWVKQSKLDRTHPMIAQKGHLAFIVPWYAERLDQGLQSCGVFEYRGALRWKHWVNPCKRVSIIPHEH